MTLPRSPRPNYTETLPSFFLRPSFGLHGPYYYKAVALIPSRPCAIHSPLVRLVAALPTPFASLFLLFTFCLVTCTAFLQRLAGFDAEIETAPDRGHYRVSIVRRSVSRLAGRFISLFPTISFIVRAIIFTLRHERSRFSFFPPRSRDLGASRFSSQ